MDKIVSLVSLAPQTRSNNDDDFADRLSSRYTVIMLVVFAIVVGMNQYVGTPITCWAPVHFTGSHIKYTNSYCWVRNTYYLPWNMRIPPRHDAESRQMVTYYQWISFILLGQAIFFYLPTVIWHAFNSKGGIDADNILEAANELSRTEKAESREKTINMVTKQVDRFLESRKQPQKFQMDIKHLLSATLCRCCGRRMGNYLVLLFIFSKLFYILNAIGQLWALNRILGIEYNRYGIQVVRDMVADHDWTESTIVAFPRVTLCDFDVRRLGNIHPYTVQCVLPINLYSEKIYIFLWFWIVLVALVSICSFLVWCARFAFQPDRLRFVRNHLRSPSGDGDRLESERDMELSKAFLNDYLRQDGAFLLRLIAHNTNSITTSEITCSIWDFWKKVVVDGGRKKRGGTEEPVEARKPPGTPGFPPPYAASCDKDAYPLHPSAPPTPDRVDTMPLVNAKLPHDQADTLPLKKPLPFDDDIDTMDTKV